MASAAPALRIRALTLMDVLDESFRIYRANFPVLAGLAILLAIPLLAGARITSSQDAAARGDAATAIKDALDARSIQPWAATPYLQVALVAEQAGRYSAALAWIGRAIARAPDNWQLWLVQARIDLEFGDVAGARQSLDRARALNPRSPLFRA